MFRHRWLFSFHNYSILLKHYVTVLRNTLIIHWDSIFTFNFVSLMISRQISKIKTKGYNQKRNFSWVFSTEFQQQCFAGFHSLDYVEDFSGGRSQNPSCPNYLLAARTNQSSSHREHRWCFSTPPSLFERARVDGTGSAPFAEGLGSARAFIFWPAGPPARTWRNVNVDWPAVDDGGWVVRW